LNLLNRLKYINISTRISILLALIIVLTMGIFSTLSLLKQEDDSINIITNNSNQLCATIEKILRFSMLENRRDEITKALKDIVGKDGIRTVRILNHEGLIKYSSKQSDINQQISQSNPRCTGCHVNKDNMLVSSTKNFVNYRIDKQKNLVYNFLPIYNAHSCYTSACHSSGEMSSSINLKPTNGLQTFHYHDSSQTVLGFIEIEVSTEKIASNLGHTRSQLILITIIIALLASILTYFSIRTLVGKPVKNLVEGTRRVAKGNLKQEIPPGKAELGELSHSFNLMQKQLLTTQSQLIESEKLASIGKLADEIAYEISNPLTGIIVFSENLSKDSGEDKIKDYKVIHTEALRIREIVRNILTITKRELPEFKDTNVNEVINHSISIVNKLSNFQNIQIVNRLQKSVPNISADSGLLDQVFLNLLLISSESMSNGGIINISTNYFKDNGEIDIIFSDTGKGMSEQILQKLSAPNNTSGLGSTERTGISLAVCKNIIEMHKGSLSIESKPGSGTSILIKLLVNS